MKKLKYILLSAVTLTASLTTLAQKSMNKVEFKAIASDKSFYELVPKNPKLEVLSDESKWAEGPVILPNGDVLWSDIVNNRLLNWNEKEGTKVWMFPAQFHNGHALDSENRIVAASHGKRAVERLEKDGSWTILVDLYEDKKLNSPNDLIIDKGGDIWFTDPLFGIKKENEGYGGNPVAGGEFVYRFNPKTKKLVRLNTPEVVTPNGIGLSKDEKTLYVSESEVEHTKKSHNNRNLVAYDVDSDKNVSNGRVIFQFEDGVPDGLSVDAKGNIWATSGHNIYIVSPKGKKIGQLVFPKNVANLVFAKHNNTNVAYITGSNYLFRLNVLVGGSN